MLDGVREIFIPEILELKELYFEEGREIRKLYQLRSMVDEKWCDRVKDLIHYCEVDEIFSSEKGKQKGLAKKYLQDIFGKGIKLKSLEDGELSRSLSFTTKNYIYTLCVPVIQNLTLENFHDYDEGMMRLSILGIDGSLKPMVASYMEKDFSRCLIKY